MWRNNEKRFGVIAMLLHWIMAVMILGLLGVGLYMVRLDPSPFLFKLYSWHKSIGIMVLAFFMGRLIWRLISKPPNSLDTHKPWERKLSKVIHIVLYASMASMPLSGWIMSSAKNFSVSVFGWFTLPNLVGPSEKIADIAVLTHEISSKLLIAAILLHAAGALKHHVIDKDATLRRMVPFTKVSVVFAIFVLGMVTGKAQANEVPGWTIIKDESRIEFEATQMGAAFTGTFKKFTGDIKLDPENPQTGSIRIVIDTSSGYTASKDRDQYLSHEAWFYTESFPESVFMSENITKVDGNQYLANGSLTIRDVTLPVQLPFTLTIQPSDKGEMIAHAQGELSLQRLDYNIGTGDWSDPSTVGNKVSVRVSVKAKASQ